MRKQRIFLCIIAVLAVYVDSAICDGGGPIRPAPDEIALIREIEGYGSSVMEFSPSGRWLGLVAWRRWAILDPIEGRAILTAEFQVLGSETTDQCCTFSDDERFFAASVNGALTVVDLSSGEVLISYEHSHGSDPLWSMGALAFTPDGKSLLIGGQMTHVYVLSLPTAEVVDSLWTGSTVGIEIMPDSRTAAVATWHGGVLLSDWNRNAVVDTLSECGSWCNVLESAGPYLLAGWGSHTIRVWDSETFQYRGLIQGHKYIGQHFAASGKKSLLVAGSCPGSPNNPEGLTTSEIVSFDLNTRQAVHSRRAHTAKGIYDTALSADATLLATCGYDGVIKIWDVSHLTTR